MRIIERVASRELTGSRAFAASLAGAGLTAVCAQVAFHLPGNPVPVTMQVFAVIFCGMLLGARLAALAQLEYLAVGMAGAPVFAGFKGGWAAVAGPTGGYLAGFVIAAYVVGVVARRYPARSTSGLALAGLLGVAVIHVFGRAWFAVWLHDLTGLTSWALGVAPFVGLDAAKVAAAVVLCGGGKR